MGNVQPRPSLTPPRRRSNPSNRSVYADRNQPEGSRSARSSRPDLSFLHIGGSSERDRDVATLEHRRETKQEREARRLEKERAARLKERERSMKEENVDGGYLVTQGVYVGPEDFSKAVTRQLMVERRLAPFWRGLNEFSDSWAEHQLMAAARGMSIPPPDEIPPELEYKCLPKQNEDDDKKSLDIKLLTVPISSRSQSYASDGSGPSLPSPTSSVPGTGSSNFFRSRAKTLASLTSSRHSSQVDLTPREVQLPKDQFVNGQPMEVYLYKDATECPICFLYYPPYLNRTRCCDQPICSECFVQIKRPDPHPPEHGEAGQATNAEANAEANTEGDDVIPPDCQLVSEPSACPFCVQPEFGVTYSPPPFRRGLVYATDPILRTAFNIASPVSSTTSLISTNVTPTPGRRRATSLSATDPSVVTTDKIRPDWAQKLSNARAQAARRSAAATALHAAAYLMTSNQAGPNDSRNYSLGRRSVIRRSGLDSLGGGSTRSGSSALNALAFLTERRAGDSSEDGSGNASHPHRRSSRRSRLDDLEEMMMMEAIRLSLASEEERRRREEKEVRKEAKKREKEAKKAEKAARKNGLYSNNPSSSAIDSPSESKLAKIGSSASLITGEDALNSSKGKGIERAAPSATGMAGDPSSAMSSSQTGSVAAQASPSDQKETMASVAQQLSTEPVRRSHLRHVSSASSSLSSLLESTVDNQTGSRAADDGCNSALEPMFNFRSLAAVIGDEEKREGCAEHLEDARPRTESSASGTAPAAIQGTDTSDLPTTEAGHVSSAHSTIVASSIEDRCIPKEIEARSVEINSAASAGTAS